MRHSSRKGQRSRLRSASQTHQYNVEGGTIEQSPPFQNLSSTCHETKRHSGVLLDRQQTGTQRSTREEATCRRVRFKANKENHFGARGQPKRGPELACGTERSPVATRAFGSCWTSPTIEFGTEPVFARAPETASSIMTESEDDGREDSIRFCVVQHDPAVVCAVGHCDARSTRICD